MELGTLKRFFGGNYLDEIAAEMVEDFKAARKQERRQKAKAKSEGRTVSLGYDSESSIGDVEGDVLSSRTNGLFCQKSCRGRGDV
jgi:hypothetical protein